MSKKKKTLEELLEEALVPKEEQPYDIPENWNWTKLGIISEWGSGGTPKSTNKEYYDGDIPWLIISDLNDGIVSHSEKKITELGLKNSSAKLVPKDTLLVAMYGSIGKLGITDMSCTTNQAIAFAKEPKVNIKFLFYYLLCIREKLKSLGKGGTQQNISQTVLKEVPIPIPLIKEQQKIVSKIEILFVKIDEAQQLIREAKETFEHRRAAIFSLLFQKNVESVKNKSENEPYKLPVGWKWLKLSEVGTLKRGKSKHRPRNDAKLFDGPYPFIQTGDVARAEKYIESYSQTLSEFGLAQSALFEKGTLCITIAANIADTALLNFDSCFPDSVVGFSSNHEYISNEYIHYYISTIKQELEHYAPATAQKNINLKVLNEVLVPIPPHEEYFRIIGAIKDLELKERSIFNLIDLEKQINQLKQSILSKAFKGELGTNESTDESAIELLKSILQEKL